MEVNRPSATRKYVYVLRCPSTALVRYVGMCASPSERRGHHLNLPNIHRACKWTMVNRWVWAIWPETPMFDVVAVCETSGRWVDIAPKRKFSSGVLCAPKCVAESVEHSLIRRMRSLGLPLLNLDQNDQSKQDVVENALSDFGRMRGLDAFGPNGLKP